MYLLAALLLALAVVFCWVLTVVGLPGTWTMVVLVAGYSWLGPAEGREAIGSGVVASLLSLAVGGEVVEWLGTAWNARKVDTSRRAVVLALVGSIVGAIVGAVVGLPIPVIGWIAGTILFAAVGALLGAGIGETWKGRDSQQAWRAGMAAFWGRIFGSFAKVSLAAAMVALIWLALLL